MEAVYVEMFEARSDGRVNKACETLGDPNKIAVESRKLILTSDIDNTIPPKGLVLLFVD